MTPMPEQNPLPFPDDAAAARASDPAHAPASATGGDAAGSVPPATALPSPVLAARAAKRPLWARLLGRVADPWLGLNIEPAEPGQYDDGRPVVYVLEDYGLSNALILDKACREAGLPSPLVPMPGDPLGRK